MKTFKYTWNHKEDEAYMEKMCQKGWATIRLVEGIWTFEPCKPGQYAYRRRSGRIENEASTRGN